MKFVPSYLVRDEKHLADLARTKPRLFERLWQWVIGILNRRSRAMTAGERIAIENRFRAAMNAAKTQKSPASNSGVEYMAYIGDTKDGRRCYESGFDSSVSMDVRIEEFKNKISTIFNLGAVELKTDVKKSKSRLINSHPKKYLWR